MLHRDEGTHSMQLTADYIVGLVDGEGSFTAYVRKPKGSKGSNRRARIEPRFYIKLIEKDKRVLGALQGYFGCGSVYFQKDRRKNHQHCYRFEVFNRKELREVIVPFFRRHALQFPSKRKDFKIFCALMEGLQAGTHLTETGLGQLFLLKQKMH